jgi:hypothetical protein
MADRKDYLFCVRTYFLQEHKPARLENRNTHTANAAYLRYEKEVRKRPSICQKRPANISIPEKLQGGEKHLVV